MSGEQDREQLEAAARAAGYQVEWNKLLKCLMFAPTQTAWYEPWRPLDSDADAFRLMVACGVDVATTHNRVSAIVEGGGGVIVESESMHVTDKHAATRRAIVRAAAAMSEGQE